MQCFSIGCGTKRYFTSSIRMDCEIIYFSFQKIKHPDLYMLVICIAIATSTSNLFLYSFFGKSASDDIASFSDQLYDSNWSALPHKAKKLLIIMIINTQKVL